MVKHWGMVTLDTLENTLYLHIFVIVALVNEGKKHAMGDSVSMKFGTGCRIQNNGRLWERVDWKEDQGTLWGAKNALFPDLGASNTDVYNCQNSSNLRPTYVFYYKILYLNKEKESWINIVAKGPGWCGSVD